MHTFNEALSGGGNPAGIIVGGQPLSSYEPNSSGQYGLWSLIKYLDSSTESPNLETEGGTTATLYVVAVFKPLSSLFGKGAQQSSGNSPNGYQQFGVYDAIGFGADMGELYRQGYGAVQFGRSLESAEKALQYSKIIKAGTMSASRTAFNTSVTAFKTAGKGIAFIGVAASALEFATSDRSGGDYAKLGGAIIITSTAFIPVVGPFISVGLGLLDGAGAFDGIYNSFDH